jgi:pentose-5-phosphate-3-epimerase
MEKVSIKKQKAIVVPTITAYDPAEYHRQMELVTSFAPRVHIDVMDMEFAGVESVPMDKIWWPEGITADIHMMVQDPTVYLDQILMLKPHMVVVPAERHSWVDLPLFANTLVEAGIIPGLAFLQDTPLDGHEYLIPHFPHVLIFSGHLGHHGGVADLSLLAKAKQIKDYHRWTELGWDGGINLGNKNQLTDSCVTVLNVGSTIHSSENPTEVYRILLDD